MKEMNYGNGIYSDKAIMEEETNGGGAHGGGVLELLGGDGADEAVNLRAGFGVVVNGELPRQPLAGITPEIGQRRRAGEEEEEKEKQKCGRHCHD